VVTYHLSLGSTTSGEGLLDTVKASTKSVIAEPNPSLRETYIKSTETIKWYA
jgi:hypothetical protein